LGFYHVGVVKALMTNGLMPRVLGGSSAGSIVTAIVATRTDEECFRDFFEVQGTHAPGHSGVMKVDFFRPVGYNGNNAEVKVKDTGLKRYFQLFVPLTLRNFSSFIYDILTGGKRPTDILKNDTRHLEACLRANIGDFTFQEGKWNIRYFRQPINLYRIHHLIGSSHFCSVEQLLTELGGS